MALVLADRGDRLDRRVVEFDPWLRSTGPRRLQGSGLERGYAAGQRADLGGTRLDRRSTGELAETESRQWFT